MIRMIVAIDRGNAIGWNDGRLAWKIPADMARFKELTTGSTVIMGSNTFRSLGRPKGLPNRRNMVVTSQAQSSFDPEIVTVKSLDYVELERGLGPQWIIGGASVYTQALERQMVDEIHVTMIDATSGADVTLPFDLYSWKLYLIREREKRGISWDVVDITELKTEAPSPRATVLVLRKRGTM